MRDFLESPFNDETQTMLNQAGRAERVEPSRLRADFAQALQRSLSQNEEIQGLVAIRPFSSGGTIVRATVLALTDRAIICLRQPHHDYGRYGIRALIIPYRTITTVELGERLLLGAFKVGLRGGKRVSIPTLVADDEIGTHLEMLYHALDEQLFADLLCEVRELANV